MEKENIGIEELYNDKHLEESSKKELIDGISNLQAIGEVVDLYFAKSIKTTLEFLNLITKTKK